MDELVPEGHILRCLDEVIDWLIIDPRVAPLYSEHMGRRAGDPELMVRFMLLSYLFNHSERNLYATLPMHAGNLWFCGLGFESVQHPETADLRLPDRTTLVKTRSLWRERGIFDDLMRYVVEQCIAAGLVQAIV